MKRASANSSAGLIKIAATAPSRHQVMDYQNHQKQHHCVKLLANAHGNVLYTGVTTDLIRRVYEHKNKIVAGFTQKYNIDRLVYFEACPDIMATIAREKQIKGSSRKKNDPVNALNSEWADLYPSLC